MTLTEFLAARLDEDERTARAAAVRATVWPVNGTWNLEDVEHNVVGEEEAFCHSHNAEHIARHDPARALAEVEAKRRILDEHRDDGDGGCYGCGLGNDGERLHQVGECPTLRALATVYADHPDYREEWRPDS